MKYNDLKVWWVPQIPGKAFEVAVSSIEEGKKLLDVLADYDQFQYENGIKPDFCNAGGIVRYEHFEDDDEPSWVDVPDEEMED